MDKLCNQQIMASALMEWTLGSQTTFLEAKGNEVLIEKAKKLGIELPSPDLAAFETIYCEVDKFNRNGVKFSKEVAKKGLKTLYGKQINWNHSGANQICGYIIDSEIKEDKIYITGILFKSLFKAEFDEVIKLFAEKQLFVSFELWNKKENGKSIIRDLGNGQRELTEFLAHGCALLLIDPNTGDPIPPACPEAQVKKLLASTKVIEEAENIVEKIFEKDDSLVYAELAINQTEGGKDNIMEEIQLNKDEEQKVEKTQESEIVEAAYECECLKCGKVISSESHCRDKNCPECGGEMRRKDRPGVGKGEEEKVQETPEQAQVEQPAVDVEPKVDAAVTEPIVEAPITDVTPVVPAEEVPPEQAQVAEAPVEAVEANVTKTVTEVVETVDTTNPAQDVLSKDVKAVSVTVDNDGKELQKVEVEHKEVVTYTYEQVAQQVAEVKAELEKKLLEKEQEIALLKQELEQKSQEISNLTVAKEETEVPVLTVGNILPTADKYREIQNGINAKAYPKK